MNHAIGKPVESYFIYLCIGKNASVNFQSPVLSFLVQRMWSECSGGTRSSWWNPCSHRHSVSTSVLLCVFPFCDLRNCPEVPVSGVTLLFILSLTLPLCLSSSSVLPGKQWLFLILLFCALKTPSNCCLTLWDQRERISASQTSLPCPAS